MYVEDYFEAEFMLNSINIHVNALGYVEGDKSWRFKNIIKPYNMIYFVLDGEITMNKMGSDENMILVPGNAYLIPGNTAFSYKCTDNMKKLFINFDINLMNGYDLFHNLKDCVQIPCDSQLLLKYKEKFLQPDAQSIVLFKQYIYNIINDYISLESVSKELNINYKYSELITNVFILVHQNISTDITVAYLADKLCISQSYLSRRFKQEFGVGIKKYIGSILCIKAKKMLVNRELNIKDIAYNLKFKDQYHFCKFFKSFEGITPSEYRNKVSRTKCKK